jgi:hypothetical protein
MPRYIFKCSDKHQSERDISFSEFDKLRKAGFVCPQCGKPAVIQLSYFALGGGLAHNESYPNDRRGVARKRARSGTDG